jgi:hypothetical protein
MPRGMSTGDCKCYNRESGARSVSSGTVMPTMTLVCAVAYDVGGRFWSCWGVSDIGYGLREDEALQTRQKRVEPKQSNQS